LDYSGFDPGLLLRASSGEEDEQQVLLRGELAKKKLEKALLRRELAASRAELAASTSALPARKATGAEKKRAKEEEKREKKRLELELERERHAPPEDEGDSSRPPRDPTPVTQRPPPRFPVGSRVACVVKNPGDAYDEDTQIWAPGTVVANWWREPRWHPLEFAPYQVQLDAWDPAKVGLYKLNAVDPKLASAWFQPLNLRRASPGLKPLLSQRSATCTASKFAAFACNLHRYTTGRYTCRRGTVGALVHVEST
jgi:hypothetical protein